MTWTLYSKRSRWTRLCLSQLLLEVGCGAEAVGRAWWGDWRCELVERLPRTGFQSRSVQLVRWILLPWWRAKLSFRMYLNPSAVNLSPVLHNYLAVEPRTSSACVRWDLHQSCSPHAEVQMTKAPARAKYSQTSEMTEDSVRACNAVWSETAPLKAVCWVRAAPCCWGGYQSGSPAFQKINFSMCVLSSFFFFLVLSTHCKQK